jgi:hypothetical protein
VYVITVTEMNEAPIFIPLSPEHFHSAVKEMDTGYSYDLGKQNTLKEKHKQTWVSTFIMLSIFMVTIFFFLVFFSAMLDTWYDPPMPRAVPLTQDKIITNHLEDIKGYLHRNNELQAALVTNVHKAMTNTSSSQGDAHTSSFTVPKRGDKNLMAYLEELEEYRDDLDDRIQEVKKKVERRRKTRWW